MELKVPKQPRSATLAAVSLLAIVWAATAAGDVRAPVGASAAPPQQSSREPAYATLHGPQPVFVTGLPEPGAARAEGKQVSNPARTPSLGVRAMGDGAAEVPAPNALDRAGRSPQLRTPPPDLLTGFDGLDSTDNPVALTPPDPQIAVGPDHVVEFVNVTGRISTKTGVPVSTFLLRDFFLLPPDSIIEADPKIIYDDIDDRFFASYFDLDFYEGSHVYLAVSQTDDPTAGWYLYSLARGTEIPDYPGIGVTNDKVTVSINLFEPDETYIGEQTVVIQKSDMLAGLAADTATFPVRADRFTVRPAQNLSPGDDQHLATWDVSVLDELTVVKVTGTPEAGNVTEVSTNLTTLVQDTPPPSLTAGPGSIDSGDFRVLEAVWREDSLWSASSAACLPLGDGVARSCAHLVEVDTGGTPAVVQDIMFGAAGEYYSWPAIRTDSSGNLYVSLSHANSTVFAGARVAGRLASDSPGMMRGSCLLKAGEIVHQTDRWGDYLGAAVDPADPSTVWVVGQYAKDDGRTRWGTYIGSLSYSASGGCGSPLDVDTDWDGCSDERELGPDPGLGGERDPASFWDFFDVPTGAGLTRDRDVTGQDIFAVIGRFNAADVGPGEFDRNSDPLSTPNQHVLGEHRTNYHPAYDRGPLVGPYPWDLGAADGAITGADIFAVIAQFGHTCV